MIRYALSCSDGHAFEGWFASSEEFDRQLKRSLVACPSCGSLSVEKTLMAPNVATSRMKTRGRRAELASRLSSDVAKQPRHVEAGKAEASVPMVANVTETGEAAAMLRKLREHLTANAEYVGDKFAEEARRIHYEEVEKRGIYGEATPDDARALAEEGIEFHPLPVLPEDHN